MRLLPLSVALLATAIGVPRLAPRARPRLIVRLGLSSMTAGTLVLIGGISPGAGAGIVTIPMLLMGLGIGALASQLGAVTVSAVPDRESAEVGGLQNTVTNLGASLGTALVGAVPHRQPDHRPGQRRASQLGHPAGREDARPPLSSPQASRSSPTAT